MEGKFYSFFQNNVGGKLIKTEDLDEVVVIEALSEEEAVRKFDTLIGGVNHFCHCCGYRWTQSFDTGKDAPTYMDCAAMLPEEADSLVYKSYGVVHCLNGEKKAVAFPTI